jgi:hypothetical protein
VPEERRNITLSCQRYDGVKTFNRYFVEWLQATVQRGLEVLTCTFSTSTERQVYKEITSDRA